MKYLSEEIVLYGAGGAGRELAYALSLDLMGGWDPIGFLDDTKTPGELINEIPVLGGMEWLRDSAGNIAVCVVEDPKVKRGLVARIKAICPKATFPLVISPQSFVSPFIEWGEGCIVAQPFNHLTVNIKIGNFVWINSCTAIGHDTVIGDFTTLFSGIQVGGHVRIGADCVIGTGAILKPGVTIGDGATVGSGAVVVKDVPKGGGHG
jgi:sugar O-acyltransferase (sialic acid O-acetyltransferase NeuD family)